MKYKNFQMSTKHFYVLFSMLIFGILFLSAFSPQKALAAGTCYVEAGNLRVSPKTHSCPSGSQYIYKNLSDSTIPQAVSGDCYVTKPVSQGVSSITYREGDCNSLEQLRNNARRELCQSSGGTWSQPDGKDGKYTGTCECKDYQIYSLVTNECANKEAEGNTGIGANLELDEDGSKIQKYIQNTVNLLTALAGLAITVSFIIAGIQYSTSGGNPQTTANARQRIGNSVLALLCLVFLYTFLQWLVPGGIFG